MQLKNVEIDLRWEYSSHLLAGGVAFVSGMILAMIHFYAQGPIPRRRLLAAAEEETREGNSSRYTRPLVEKNGFATSRT